LCSASRIEPSIVTVAPSMDRRSDLLAGHDATDVSLVAEVEHEDRELVLHAERHGRGVHHAVALPPLTEERRRELVKQVHARAEDGRVAVRNVRRHAKDELEKLEHAGDISEDDLQRAEKDLQKLTDRFVTDIDQIQGHKEQELMEV
jgi:ribosome recycling factor